MHGSTGGRWRSCVHGATEPTHPAGKPAGLSPSDLPTADQPAAYLTIRALLYAQIAGYGRSDLRRRAVVMCAGGHIGWAHLIQVILIPPNSLSSPTSKTLNSSRIQYPPLAVRYGRG